MGLLHRLKNSLDEELLRRIPVSIRRVAIVGFPNHGNVGDSAIWLGQLAYCRQRRLEVVYTCDRRTYCKVCLAKVLRTDGIILLTGGGNFGDLFHGDHALRELVIGDFPHVPILQLPQTIHFQSADSLEHTKRVISKHRDLTLLLRDNQSLAFARRHFDAQAVLSPDMALWLGPMQRPTRAVRKQLWLWRNDVEAPVEAGAAYTLSSHDIKIVDWLQEPYSSLKRVNGILTRAVVRYPRSCRVLGRLVSQTFEPLATARLNRGCNLLAEGAVVVTNRLHGHILCLLMGIPHVVLDNSYGKISQFVKTWGTDVRGVTFCDSVERARLVAEQLPDAPQLE